MRTADNAITEDWRGTRHCAVFGPIKRAPVTSGHP